jgi:hypothetical protein
VVRRALGWAPAILVALLLAACGASAGTAAKSTPTPAPSPEPGWKLYSVSAEGFAIALPSNWEKVDLNLTSADAAAAFKDNPAFVKFLQGIQLNKYIKFLGVDKQTVAGDFATNVNVVGVSLPDSVTTLDQVVAAELATYKRLQVSTMHQRVHLSAGAAEQVDYTLTPNTASAGQVLTAIKQYILLRLGAHPTEFVVTLTTKVDQASSYEVTFGKIADAFRYQ